MLKFAIKNIGIHKLQFILVVLSIMVSTGTGVLAYNIGEQVSDGIKDNVSYYSAVIGLSGSKTQLTMNTLYFADTPVGTIPYSVVMELQKDNRTTVVIPYAMADSFNGFSCVGTTTEYLSNRTLAKGNWFDDKESLEVVAGANVAKICGLEIGQEIYTNHSATDEHHTPLKVVGILEKAHSSCDNVIFTQIRTIWDVHEEQEEEEDGHGHMENAVCAVLVKTKNPADAMNLVNDYNGKIVMDRDGESFLLQAVEPMEAVRSVLEDADNTKYIVFALCAIILALNIIIIVSITILNMYHMSKEIKLMRLIGIRMEKVNLLFLLENGITGLLSVTLAFLLSRICLLSAGRYVEHMGVVLNQTKVYPMELLLLIVIFFISILPTVVCTSNLARKDGLS